MCLQDNQHRTLSCRAEDGPPSPGHRVTGSLEAVIQTSLASFGGMASAAGLGSPVSFQAFCLHRVTGGGGDFAGEYGQSCKDLLYKPESGIPPNSPTTALFQVEPLLLSGKTSQEPRHSRLSMNVSPSPPTCLPGTHALQTSPCPLMASVSLYFVPYVL